MQLIVDIKDKTKGTVLINFLKSLNYISVEEIKSEKVYLTDSHKETLDERRNSAVAEEFIPWEKAKKQLKHKGK
jgi:hypothetical protein